MKKMQIVSDEIIGLENDLQPTASPDTYVAKNGDTAVLIGNGQCLLIRDDESPVTIM